MKSIILFIVANSDNYYFLRERGSNQMESAKKIAKVIYSNTKGETYRLTSLPERYFDSTYRYFLEIWGRILEQGFYLQEIQAQEKITFMESS